QEAGRAAAVGPERQAPHVAPVDCADKGPFPDGDAGNGSRRWRCGRQGSRRLRQTVALGWRRLSCILLALDLSARRLSARRGLALLGRWPFLSWSLVSVLLRCGWPGLGRLAGGRFGWCRARGRGSGTLRRRGGIGADPDPQQGVHLGADEFHRPQAGNVEALAAAQVAKRTGAHLALPGDDARFRRWRECQLVLSVRLETAAGERQRLA